MCQEIADNSQLTDPNMACDVEMTVADEKSLHGDDISDWQNDDVEMEEHADNEENSVIDLT